MSRDVSITEDTFDRYGRLVGVVTVDMENINEVMVLNGMAWVYDRYLNHPRDSVLLLSQAYARYNRVGLWVEDSPMPPWEFRNRKSSQ